MVILGFCAVLLDRRKPRRQEVIDLACPAPDIVRDVLDGKMVLPRFSSGLFRAMFAMKEIWNGNEIHWTCLGLMPLVL
ncbi:MAG: hypothetical protein ACJAY6_003269 [Yoonia sp.]